jgi:hypothetical protein
MVLSIVVTGSHRASDRLDALLDKCGYLLRPTPEGDFIFRALYSACFVQKEVGLGNFIVSAGMEPRASCKLGKTPTVEPPSPYRTLASISQQASSILGTTRS